MKIGINASFLRKPGTGIGQVAANFIRELVVLQAARTGVQNDEFFLYCEKEPKLNFALPENFHIRTFLPFWKRDDVPRKWLWERMLGKKAEKDGCEVFLSLYQSATIIPKKIKHVMVVHDIIPRLFPEYRGNMRQAMHWKAVERGIGAADRIVAVSQSTRKDLIEFGIAKELITIAYPSVNPLFRETVSDAALDAVLKKYGLERGYIYHGGGLEVRKNAEGLLRAYKQLTTNNQQSTTNGGQKIPDLVISGKIFPNSNKLATDVEGLVQELGLEEHVKLLGFVPDEDLPTLYRGACFFVYPSLYEGFGLPVLEALSLSVPVLSSHASSLPEVGGDAVLYVDSQNIGQLTSEMERLVYDGTLRENLISKSHAQAVQFSWEKFAEKILEVIKS